MAGFDDVNGCRFEGLMRETWIYTRPACLITVQGEMMLEFYSDYTTQFIPTGIGYDKFLIGSIFNLAKLNTVPYMCAAAFFLSDSE